jgi:hypothetical protein
MLAISLTFFGEVLLADPVLDCKAHFKKNVMPTDCRYQATDILWTRPQEGEWSRDVKGERSGLVNIYVHGSLESVSNALTSNGWVMASVNKLADDEKYLAFVALDFDVHLTKDLVGKLKIFNKPLDAANRGLDKVIFTMPVSNEYFCKKIEVVAFESDNRVLKGRHHLRIFETGRVDQQNNPVWAIAANRDTGIKLDVKRPKQFFLNHKIEPNTDNERDTVAKVLLEAGAEELPSIPYVLSCPAPRDKATSLDHQALEFVMN